MYETIKELHIEIEQRIQQITSNRYGNMPPQFYDMMLNRTAIKYIQSKSNRKTNYKGEGLEDSMKRVEDFQSLKRETPWLPVLSKSSLSDVNDTFGLKRGFVQLPSNCLKFISSTSHLLYQKGIRENGYNITDIEGNGYKNLFYYPIEIFDNNGDLNNESIVIEDIEFGYYIEFNCSELIDKFDVKVDFPKVLVDLTQDILNDPDLQEAYSGSWEPNGNFLAGHINVYWQEFNGRFYKNCIIISSDKNILVNGNEPFNYTNDCFPRDSLDRYAKNDLIASENIQSTLNNPYGNKNRHLNPITELINNKLYVYQGDDFYVGEIKITYIKKPRLFSYDLNLMSDMTITPEFVDMVVSDILLILKDNTFNLVKQQTNIE